MSPSALFVTTVSITLEAFLLPFAEHFREQGWRVDAMANEAPGNPQVAASFDHAIDVEWGRSPFALSSLVRAAPTVRRAVAEGEYDIVHVHTPVAAFVTRFALRRARSKTNTSVIYTAHGFHFYRGQAAAQHHLYAGLERTAAAWTDYLVTINREDFEAAQRFRRIPAGRVRYMPGIGVDIEKYGVALSPSDITGLRSDLGLRDNDFVLTMIAEFIPRKNHALALEALARITRPDLRLLLLGTGPLETALRETVERQGLGDRVVFAGYRQDVPRVLGASDAGLLVSKHEGLARSVLETMAAGLPMIGTDTRGISDAIGARAGWIVPRGDAAALAAAIEEALDDPDETRRRGAHARERATREFALPRIIHAHQELYREVLASGV